MICKAYINLLVKTWDCNVNIIRHSSLFINGAKATENFVFVNPHIDLPGIIERRTEIQKHLQKRKHNFDLDKLENLWGLYEKLREKRNQYDKKKNDLSNELSTLLKSDPESEIIKRIKLQISLVKDNVKKLKVPLWSAEEYVMLEALKLPNNLHPNTPDDNNKILYTHPTVLNNNLHRNHLKVGNDLDIVSFKNNENYYLKGDAAIFELGAKFYVSDILKKNGFIQFSNPDFVKSVIVEGCGVDHTSSNATFILHHNEETSPNVDNRLHLTGGSSLYSFMAYHAKNVAYAKALPLKYFSIGQQYIPSLGKEENLFQVCQSSVVQFFGVTKSEQSLELMLNELVEVLKECYGNFGYHFRLCIIPASNLQMWESMRVVIEMFSSSLEKYVEVANISVSGDFISKRLMYTYTDNKESFFPYVLSGTLLNVPKLLACVLEQDCNFSVPEIFRPEKWTM